MAEIKPSEISDLLRKELAQMVSRLALEITEKVLRKEFSDKDKQMTYYKDLLNEISRKN